MARDRGDIEADIALRPARPEDYGDCAAIFNAWVDATVWMPRVHSRELRRAAFPRDDASGAGGHGG